MYGNNEQKKKIPSLDELKRLWSDSWKTSSIMTFEVASWITDNLFMLDRKEVIIQTWLDYRTDKDWRFFRHFAALQLVIDGSNTSQLIDIINEVFTIDKDFRLRYIVPQLFISQLVDVTVLRQILVKLHQNIDYSSRIWVWIELQGILELFLNLELERIISNERRPSTITTRPYLLMIKGYPEDLQIYLIEYVHLFVDVKTEIENSIKEKFLAVIIKCMTNCWISIGNRQTLSMKFYEYIFTYLDNSQFPEVQKAIFDALNSLFIFLKPPEEYILMQQIASPHLVCP
ncbi:unnamed protein product [Rotaria sp. Silwood1]|nr:unnamed protein product [Rotaria sp. Silwood1]CAF4988335.1 unnamed protein product [Rotaria sp. Silwood1]